jgi:hypothetical protein
LGVSSTIFNDSLRVHYFHAVRGATICYPQKCAVIRGLQDHVFDVIPATALPMGRSENRNLLNAVAREVAFRPEGEKVAGVLVLGVQRIGVGSGDL